jgi:thiol-disulfide isomerase/thioredoxin
MKHKKKTAQHSAPKKADTLDKWGPAILLSAIVGIIVFAGTYSATTCQAVACPSVIDASDSCVFTCEVNSGLQIPLEAGGAESCNVAGEVSVLAFHSPSCGYCDAQEPVLDELKQVYGDKLNLKYVCTEIHEGDDALCMENKDGKYVPYEEGKALVAKYQASIGGTPTLIFDCAYLRVGSYAIRDQSQGTTVEMDDLSKVLDLLLAA